MEKIDPEKTARQVLDACADCDVCRFLMVYYPPCHLREQEIGTPYVDLLQLIPGINLEKIQGRFYCCGLGGIMGFKREFHENSVQLGGDLMKKIRELNPDRLVTDCLSCRMQFHQLLPVEVVHPIEILREAYLAMADKD